MDLVSSGFSESGLTLTNGTVIDSGDYTYIGGTTLDATGGVENRSDVWVIANGTVYSSTGGARNTTSWPRASSELDVSPATPTSGRRRMRRGPHPMTPPPSGHAPGSAESILILPATTLAQRRCVRRRTTTSAGWSWVRIASRTSPCESSA